MLKQQGLPFYDTCTVSGTVAHNCLRSFIFQSVTLKIAREYKFLFYEMKSCNTEL